MRLEVDIDNQSLVLFKNARTIHHYVISSGVKGVGEVYGSEKTPRGWHIIRAKIGAGHPENTVFVERRPTGEIFSRQLYEQYPGRDWILTRILWLSGLEVGKNRLGNVDTMRRCIYVHGSPDFAQMGIPGSRGCIRMHNRDVIELFDCVSVGDKVFIKADGGE